MTFDEFKAEVINRQKRDDINQLFHLMLKATTYADIFALLGQFDLPNAFDNGIWDSDLIMEVPEADREAANIYARAVSLSDLNSVTLYLLPGAELTLSQTGTNRCKILMFGGSLDATTADTSMIELEAYQDATATVAASGTSYLHATVKNQATATITMADSAITKLKAHDEAVIGFTDADDSFMNIEAWQHADISLIDSDRATIYQNDASTINLPPV